MNEIVSLEKDIKYYADKYYRGKQEISDEQFDLLVDRLRKLKPDSEVLTTGWGFEVDGDKVKHKYSHIGSLDKCKSFDDFPDRFRDKVIFLSPKLDGLSAVAYYQNGKLIKGITRGNGTYGKDITDKLKIILGEEIADKNFTGGVRGELIIHENNWKILQNKYKDLIAPRNFAAGIINRKEIDEDIQYIDLVVYKIVGQTNKPVWTKRADILSWLGKNFKYYIPNFFLPSLTREVWEMYRDAIFSQFKQMGYGLDGIVLTRENALYIEENNSLVYDEVAYKFAAETANTIIENIEWTLSRTNRLIPVAEVQPVELSGAIVHRCTCNNAKWVKDFGLGKGASIVITRSNEVIPAILEVIEESEELLPEVCPVCKQPLIWNGVDLACNNDNCYSRDYYNLQQWCEVIGETDNFAWLLMKQYLDKFNIKTLEDLYSKKDDVLDWFRINELSITDYKAYEFFMKIYIDKVQIDKALLALNIPRLGNKTVQLLVSEKELILRYLKLCIAQQQISYDIDFTNEKDKFLNIVKDATTDAILNNKKRFANLSFLAKDDRLIFLESTNILEKKYVAVTGSLETMKRKDFEKYINRYGYELSSNLKKCIYLITNNPTSNSTKNKEAQKYNIPLITEKEFLSKLQGD